jgi:hypothetical protein
MQQKHDHVPIMPPSSTIRAQTNLLAEPQHVLQHAPQHQARGEVGVAAQVEHVGPLAVARAVRRRRRFEVVVRADRAVLRLLRKQAQHGAQRHAVGFFWGGGGGAGARGF